MKKRTCMLAFPLVVLLCLELAGAPESPKTAPPPAAAGGEISVVTLNLAKATSAPEIVAELRGVPAVRDADILLFQEMACTAEDLAQNLGRYMVWAPAAAGVANQSLAILSRWPLEDRRVQPLKSYDLRFHTRSRIALSATARTPNGPVRIWNAHLDTRLNARERLEQLAPVVDDAARFTGPRIVGGDFNTNPFYWVGRVLPVPFVDSQAGDVRNYMAARGFTTAMPVSPATFDFPRMHLDWVWTRGARSNAWAVYPMAFSDHHAVWVRVRIQSASGPVAVRREWRAWGRPLGPGRSRRKGPTTHRG